MSFALGRYLAGKISFHEPLYGVASADIELVDAKELSGSQPLTLGDVTKQGVVTGGVVAGKGRYHWKAGAGKWGDAIRPKGYGNSNGVSVATVIRELAAEVGEQVNVTSTARLGLPPFASYARLGGPAWHTLKILKVPWYVDSAGVTQIAERTGSAIPTTATLVLWERETGRRVHCPASEEIAGFLPGNTIDGEQIISLDIEAETGSPIRIATQTRAAGSVSQDWRTAIDAMIDQQTTHYRFNGVYRYRVQSRRGEMYGLLPVDDSIGLPGLGVAVEGNEVGVGMFPGIAGNSSDLANDTIVALAFFDGDPGKPFIVGFQPLGVKPINSRFDATTLIGLGDAQQLVARETDPVNSGQLEVSVLPNILVIKYTDQNNAVQTWNVAGSNGAGPVTFVVTSAPNPIVFAAPIVGKIDTPTQNKVKA